MPGVLATGDGYWLALSLLGLLLGTYAWLLLKLVQQLRQPTKAQLPQSANTSANSQAWLVALLALSVGLLCLLPLADYWVTGYSGYHSIGGLLPYSDAADWLHGAMHLATQGELTDWSARRPLNAVFLSGLLHLSDFQIPLLLILRALLLAAALTSWCLELQRLMPKFPALFTSLLVVVLAYPYLPVLLSESHGLLFSLLGFTLLLRGVVSRHLPSYATGTGLLSCALMLRMGGFGILLALLVWPLMLGRRSGSLRWLLYSAASIGIGIGLSLVWGNLVYSGANSSGSNFSYTLYGLVQGGAPWQLFFEHYPQAKLEPEARQAAMAYAAAWAEFQRNPFGLLRGWWQFFANYWRYLFVWVPGSLGQFLLPVFALGLVQLSWGWRHASNRFILLCFVGVLLTTPWIYWSANASRAFIATTLLELVIVARGLHVLILGGQGLWLQASQLTLQQSRVIQPTRAIWLVAAIALACLTIVPSWASRSPAATPTTTTTTTVTTSMQTRPLTCLKPAQSLLIYPKLALYIDFTTSNDKRQHRWHRVELTPQQFSQQQMHKNLIAQTVIKNLNSVQQLWWVFDPANPNRYRYLMLGTPIPATQYSPIHVCAKPLNSQNLHQQKPTPPLLWQAVAS